MLIVDNTIFGTPSVIKKITFIDSLFLNTKYRATVLPKNYSNGTGNSCSDSKLGTIYAGLGEQIERHSVYYNKEKSINKIPAISLTSESIMYIDPTKIYLNFDLPGLKNYKKSFQDSCGLASYTDSENTVINSLKEFIERQSFITTWLTKKTKAQYKISEVNNLFQDKNEMLENYFSSFECFDISIFPGIYVLFLIGYSDQIYSVGIGTSTSFKEAYRSALNEFYQCFDAAIASYSNSNKKAIDIYKDYYMSIGVGNFKKAYDFLKRSPIQNIPFDEIQRDNINNLIDIINFFGLEAYLIAIPSQVKNANIRITKVFSYDAFPHMNTTILKPENYKISKILNIEEFPNKGIPIPFP